MLIIKMMLIKQLTLSHIPSNYVMYKIEKDFFITHYGFLLENIHRNEHRFITEIYNWKILHLIFSEVTQNTSHIFFKVLILVLSRISRILTLQCKILEDFLIIFSCVVKHDKLQGSVSKQKFFTFF